MIVIIFLTAYMLQDQEAHASQVFHSLHIFYNGKLESIRAIFAIFTTTSLFFMQMERTFIAIKPDGVQRGLVI